MKLKKVECYNPNGKKWVGEIFIRGLFDFKGYYKQEENSKIVFINDWFHLDNVGKINEDNERIFIDRIKQLVKWIKVNIFN
jgi:long-subunit acyl-CoA synthetase (AMP-forming)